MRLQRKVPVAGIDPALARALAIACQADWAYTGYIASRCKISVADADSALDALAAEGFVERRDVDILSAERADQKQLSVANQWTTTLSGGALTMASFLKPISRRKAEALLRQVIERAQTYNADDTKPLLISEITVFGSYLPKEVTELGDLDPNVTLTDRIRGGIHGQERFDYAARSGRRFSTMIDELAWPEQEARQILRKGSGHINIHTEDLSRFTDTTELVYRLPPAA